MSEFRDQLVDALNQDWDGGAYGSICPEDIVDIQIRLGVVTIELSDARGGQLITRPADRVLNTATESRLAMKLTAVRGYSGSGKSTKAREIADATGAVVVNRDLLRLQLLGDYWTGVVTDEDRVTIAEVAQVEAFLKGGVSVVVDATHLEPRYLRKWARTASKHGADFEVVDVIADVAVCRQRDHARMLDGGRYVGDSVIDRQAKRWPVEKWPTIEAIPPFVVEPVAFVIGVPPAIIVDIDGTLAHCEGNRSPYDYTKVLGDRPDHIVIQLVQDWKEVHPWGAVLVVSGRDDTCYPDTEKWLKYHNVPLDGLFMRPTDAKDAHGNKLADFIVKYDLFNAHIRNRFNVQFCLDDRRQVIDKCWRAMGLKVLDVAGNEF